MHPGNAEPSLQEGLQAGSVDEITDDLTFEESWHVREPDTAVR